MIKQENMNQGNSFSFFGFFMLVCLVMFGSCAYNGLEKEREEDIRKTALLNLVSDEYIDWATKTEAQSITCTYLSLPALHVNLKEVVSCSGVVQCEKNRLCKRTRDFRFVNGERVHASDYFWAD